MSDTYRDFIPENEDPGALGAGFTDFVPVKEPVKTEPKPEVKTVVKEEKK